VVPTAGNQLQEEDVQMQMNLPQVISVCTTSSFVVFLIIVVRYTLFSPLPVAAATEMQTTEHDSTRLIN